MVFTKLGRFIAWLMVIVGMSRVAKALAVIYNTGQNVSPRYLGSKTTGEVIDAALLYILIGVAVGMLAEISRSVAAKAEAHKQEPK